MLAILLALAACDNGKCLEDTASGCGEGEAPSENQAEEKDIPMKKQVNPG